MADSDMEEHTYEHVPMQYRFDRTSPRLKHEHQFTIPVVWELTKSTVQVNEHHGITGTTKDITRVTKLRCPCGEETERQL